VWRTDRQNCCCIASHGKKNRKMRQDAKSQRWLLMTPDSSRCGPIDPSTLRAVGCIANTKLIIAQYTSSMRSMNTLLSLQLPVLCKIQKKCIQIQNIYKCTLYSKYKFCMLRRKFSLKPKFVVTSIVVVNQHQTQ